MILALKFTIEKVLNFYELTLMSIFLNCILLYNFVFFFTLNYLYDIKLMCTKLFAFSDSSGHVEVHLGIHRDLTTSLTNVDQRISTKSLQFNLFTRNIHENDILNIILKTGAGHNYGRGTVKNFKIIFLYKKQS